MKSYGEGFMMKRIRMICLIKGELIDLSIK